MPLTRLQQTAATTDGKKNDRLKRFLIYRWVGVFVVLVYVCKYTTNVHVYVFMYH